MSDIFEKLYDSLASRKGEANAIGPYHGGNGRIDRAVELIRRGSLPKSGVLIDVGGATGNLGYALRDLFTDRYVVEIAEACREPAKSKGNGFIFANIEKIGLSMFESGSTDLIVALDFIEHILDPERFVQECSRVLRPGGAALINTPNIQFWRHLSSLAVDGVFPHTSGDREVYHGGHVAFYTYDDMLKLFSNERGFCQQSVYDPGNSEPAPPIWNHLISRKDQAFLLNYPDLLFSCHRV